MPHVQRIDKRRDSRPQANTLVTGAAGRETVLEFGSPMPLDDYLGPVDATGNSAGRAMRPLIGRARPTPDSGGRCHRC
jgi:hypothetical protein